MNYIILDMEWNQPFGIKKMLKRPIVLHGEIVQIGAVKLDENHHLIDTFKIAVKPAHYTTMNKKVSKLTNIKTEDLQYGFPFKVAFKHFSNWCGDDFAFLTWGPDDIEMLRENMNLHGINTEWIPCTYNLQIIFDSQLTKTNHQISLKHAMEYVGETPLEYHDALNDAKNTASLCHHLDIDRGVVEYTDLAKGFNKSSVSALEKYRNGKTYPTRQDVFDDRSMLMFCCPNCGAKVLCVGFKRQNDDKYICLGKCENGEEYFVRFKFSKGQDGRFSVVRIVYEMDEKNFVYYHSKNKQCGSDNRMFSEHSEAV